MYIRSCVDLEIGNILFYGNFSFPFNQPPPPPIPMWCFEVRNFWTFELNIRSVYKMLRHFQNKNHKHHGICYTTHNIHVKVSRKCEKRNCVCWQQEKEENENGSRKKIWWICSKLYYDWNFSILSHSQPLNFVVSFLLF